MAKKKRKKTTARRNTPLEGHRQRGKVLKSPLGDIPNTRAVPWLRDQFPDYLWVCWHLAGDLDRGRSLVVATLRAANRILDEVIGNAVEDRTVLDGSLTAWESVPLDARAPILAALAERDVHDLAVPEAFAQVLGMYPGAPGEWLISRWRDRSGFRVDPAVAERSLSPVIVAGADGRDQVATHAKMVALHGIVMAGKVKFARSIETVELLPLWPDHLDDDQRALVESFVRASFGAMAGMVYDDDVHGRLKWAQRFWRSNWDIYPCRVAEGGSDNVDAQEIRAVVAEFAERANGMWVRFERAASVADPDLYDPDRNEVLTGLAARALRVASAAINSPAEWTLEHSASSIRSVVESLITLTWLTEREDSDMYRRFKDYGRGHLKLQKLHWEQFADTLDEVPEAVKETISDLSVIVNQDLDEEFQNIDLGGSFSGIDTRKMAYEVGLERDYRLVFAPTSSDAHGEWGHLDRYVLSRCLSPTHRWHRIPRQSIVPAVVPQVISALLDLADRVIDRYVDVIGAPTSTGDPVKTGTQARQPEEAAEEE